MQSYGCFLPFWRTHMFELHFFSDPVSKRFIWRFLVCCGARSQSRKRLCPKTWGIPRRVPRGIPRGISLLIPRGTPRGIPLGTP